MKRSRIFLGLTASVLAIAGTVAAKTSHGPKINRYYFTALGQQCVAAQTVCVRNVDATVTCRTANLQGAYYTQRTSGATKCLNILHYTKI